MAWRKIRDLSGADCCSLSRIKMPGLAGFGVPEAAQELALRRRRDQLELVGEEPVLAVGGQGGQPAVGVEHRRQREHLGDRFRVGDPDCPDPVLDGFSSVQRARAEIERPTGTTSSTTPMPPSFDSTVW